jgi:hypothetical protein
MRGYAFGAVRTAMTNQRRGLNANPAAQAGMRTFFRLCNAVPALKHTGFRDSWANCGVQPYFGERAPSWG